MHNFNEQPVQSELEELTSARNYIEQELYNGEPRCAMQAAYMATDLANMNREIEKLEYNEFWQTQARGTNESEYQIYLACADDGNGMDITTNSERALKTYDEWLAS